MCGKIVLTEKGLIKCDATVCDFYSLALDVWPSEALDARVRVGPANAEYLRAITFHPELLKDLHRST